MSVSFPNKCTALPIVLVESQRSPLPNGFLSGWTSCNVFGLLQRRTIALVLTSLTSKEPLLRQLLNSNSLDSHFFFIQTVSGRTLWNVSVKLARRTCELDPLPTSLLYDWLDALLPHIVRIINESLVFGIFPNDFKRSTVRLLLKQLPLIQTLWKTKTTYLF